MPRIGDKVDVIVEQSPGDRDLRYPYRGTVRGSVLLVVLLLLHETALLSEKSLNISTIALVVGVVDNLVSDFLGYKLDNASV